MAVENLSPRLSPEKQLDILKRGAVDIIDEGELLDKLKKGLPLRVKAGFDPSKPDLHLGHSLLIRKLRQFQELGHIAHFIVGDWTACVGDPSGQNKTRPSLSFEEAQKNAQTYMEQATKANFEAKKDLSDEERLILRFFKRLDPAKTERSYNSNWLDKLSLKEFILKISSKFTVARQLERNDFSLRYKDKKPIGLHEFLYPLLQAYDSVQIEADVELGGTDQLFNLLLGRELQKEFGQKPQTVLTLPLLEGIDSRRGAKQHSPESAEIQQGAKQHSLESADPRQGAKQHSLESADPRQGAKQHSLESADPRQGAKQHSLESADPRQGAKQHSPESADPRQGAKQHSLESAETRQGAKQHSPESADPRQGAKQHSLESADPRQGAKQHSLESADPRQGAKQHSLESADPRQGAKQHSLESADPRQGAKPQTTHSKQNMMKSQNIKTENWNMPDAWKMSKSLNNAISFNDRPKDIYGKTMKISDELLIHYWDLFTDGKRKLEEPFQAKSLHPKKEKEKLAWLLVCSFYGEDEANQAQKDFQQVFAKRGLPDQIPEEQDLLCQPNLKNQRKPIGLTDYKKQDLSHQTNLKNQLSKETKTPKKSNPANIKASQPIWLTDPRSPKQHVPNKEKKPEKTKIYSPKSKDKKEISVCGLIKEAGLSLSKSEARRGILSGAVRKDGKKLTDPNETVILKKGDEFLLSFGKRKFKRVNLKWEKIHDLKAYLVYRQIKEGENRKPFHKQLAEDNDLKKPFHKQLAEDNNLKKLFREQLAEDNHFKNYISLDSIKLKIENYKFLDTSGKEGLSGYSKQSEEVFSEFKARSLSEIKEAIKSEEKKT